LAQGVLAQCRRVLSLRLFLRFSAEFIGADIRVIT